MNEIDTYGFKIEHIDDFTTIQNKSIHYIYTNKNIKVHFLYKPVLNSNGLYVTFHGAVPTKRKKLSRYTFRFYDAKYAGKSVLCLYDPLLDLYKNLQLSWYLDTQKCNTTELISEIISKIQNIENHTNLLFTGSSGGGFAAIKFASIFNGTALIQNSQLYLDKHEYFIQCVQILGQSNDFINCESSIENVVQKYGYPRKIIMYCNERDAHHYLLHSNPFYIFSQTLKHANIEYNHFYGGDPVGTTSHHKISWPSNQDWNELIKQLLHNPS